MAEQPSSELISEINEETGRFVFDSVKVLPQSLYDATRAQTAHHIKWILSCAYPQGLPDSFGTPFYIGNDSRLVLSPHVISGLVSCHVYSQCCVHLFDQGSASHQNANQEDSSNHSNKDQNRWHRTHSGILTQLASVWSLYPMEQAMLQDGNGTANQLESEASVGSGNSGLSGVPVTEQMLSQTLPFRLASHVALIESLIMARCLVVSPISRVVSETRAMCQREDAEELSTGMEELLPYDMEDALLFWINHCLLCLKKRHPAAKALEEVMELFDIVEACDGLVICVIMSLFSPRALLVQRLSEQNHSLGIPSESLAINCIYNIQIVQKYCQQLKSDPQRLFDRLLPSKLFQTATEPHQSSNSTISFDILHLELEDFLYPNKLTKSAFVLFVAELFHLFSTVYGESFASDGRAEKSSGSNSNEIKGLGKLDQNREIPRLNRSGSGGSSENSRESGDADTTLEAIHSGRGVDESIDIHSLGTLFNSVSSTEQNNERQKAEKNQIHDELMNSTYVQGRHDAGDQKDHDQRTVEGAEVNNGSFFLAEGEKLEAASSLLQQPENQGLRGYHRSNSTGVQVAAFTNRSSIASGPLGASTPSGDNSRSPQSVRKSFTSPVQSTITSSANQPPIIQSGRDTYSVRSSHVNQHRPASELFGDVHVTSREPREVGNERPRSEILDGSHEIRLKGFGHARAKTPEKESEPPSNRSSQNDEESLADNFKSLRAEMEMKRLQIQKQRAHEDKERMKQRQKISEAAFFKAIQPRSQDQRAVSSATGTPQHRHSGSLPAGVSIVRNPSMSNISVQTSIETPDASGYSLMTGADDPAMGGQRRFDEYEGNGTSIGGSQSFRQPVTNGKSNDIHRATSLDWTKSGLGSPLDAPGNVSYRGPSSHSYRGLQHPRKSGSTYDMSGLGNHPSGYDHHAHSLQQQPLELTQHEKAEKQLLIEQNMKLAQELKFLKAQYASEIGHSPEYGLSATSQRAVYPVQLPQTPSHHPVGSGSMLSGSSGHTMGSWGHKLNSSFSNFPPDHNTFMASIGNNPAMAAVHPHLGYQHPAQPIHPMNVVGPQSHLNYAFDGTTAHHGNYNAQLMGNAPYQGFPTVAATVGGMRTSPMGSQSMLSMEERHNQQHLSGSHSFLTIEAGNRRGAEDHAPSHEVSSESEDAQSAADHEQEDDSAFHQLHHSNVDDDYDSSGQVKRGDSARYGSETVPNLRSNRATSRGRRSSYRSDVDTLEAPFGVAELVNVQTGNNLSNPVTSLSRRHSERDREFVSTGIVSSPMAERRAGVASRNSINQTISAANYHQSLPRYRGDEEDVSERVNSRTSERGGGTGVPPCGVALIIGEEGDEMKLVDYETKKKVMLTKRMERLKAEQKSREEAMRAEKEKLKEHQRKLQLEIDSHRRQEKLKEKQQQQQSEGTARSGSTTRDDRSSGTQTLPNRGSTGSAVKRPKAKVAPRVKSSASNQDLNSSGHLGNKSQHEEASKQATGTPLKLYVKPQSRGNRQIIVNAINQCVLPGAVNAELKSKVLKEMNSLEGETKNFLMLFRDHNMKYRALYSYEPDTGLILKILGNGPNQIKEEMIAQLYKYNSGNKCFSSIPSKTMSVSVDGFTILNHLWKTNASSSTSTAAHSNRRPP